MIRSRIKKRSLTGFTPDVSNRNIVYATLMINSQYTNRAGTGQTGKSPEGIKNV
jgi:hypothetical protein